MKLIITITHRLGFQYQLTTMTSEGHCELDALSCAIHFATNHFGLLPAPTDFNVEVIREK